MHMLDKIIQNKYVEVEKKKLMVPLEVLEEKISLARETRNFYEAIHRNGMSLIAEVKKKSPSKGLLREDFNPVELARSYTNNGARAISVIADETFFGGSSQIVERIANDHLVNIPVMYKDFIIDKYQIYEARACGADAVLIIVRAMNKNTLSELIDTAELLKMDVLTETFTHEEVTISVEAGARIIGINNRDLQTFEVDLKKSEEMVSLIPNGRLKVSESGIKNRNDVLKAEEMGFDGMLVGESIITQRNVGRKVQELIGIAKTV